MFVVFYCEGGGGGRYHSQNSSKHGDQLEHTDKAKYLVVTTPSDLKWDSHINSITTKTNKTLGFLR